ncbi:hypothetical protein RCG23_13340 [Neobacillus sp. PS3-34]|uniref:hypothetical protein n=1 Tax=Neobacillus sp. PS3-34 TaxID=3070678 RepID=UPI0027DEE46B|nr:hypothetical protein [Neobacillus sp. PS3-34]WML46636.1 hypothetical protein RCG23_13340 [Neobacillus sp. PS3-34]
MSKVEEMVFIREIMGKILSKKIPKGAMKTEIPALEAENGLHKVDEDRNACLKWKKWSS